MLDVHVPGTILTSYPSFYSGLPGVTVETGFRQGHRGKKRQALHISYNISYWAVGHYWSWSEVSLKIINVLTQQFVPICFDNSSN